MNELRTRLAALEHAVQENEAQQRGLERRLRGWRGGAVLLVGLVLCGPLVVSQTEAATPINRRVKALEDKLAHFATQTIDGLPSVVFDGVNVHIRNGLGATNGSPQNPSSTDPGVVRTNGLGNLIVGYNELRGAEGGGDTRTGSHNVV